jgi:protocatechuate 3,4-dioxygenase beta subunit
VTVGSNTTTRAVVAIERGATISGSVTYDDGSPVESIPIQVIRVKNADSNQKDTQPIIYKKELYFHVQTDDRGMYRIAGLSPGTYVASARISMSHLQMRVTKSSATLAATEPGDVNLTFYAAATTQRIKAQQIAVTQGDERQGIDLVADLSRLHSIGGYVNGHGVMVPDAHLEFDDIDDPANRHGTVTDETGYFRFDLLPPGNYKLMAYAPQSQMDAGKRKPAVSIPVMVSNTDVLNLDVDILGKSQ